VGVKGTVDQLFIGFKKDYYTVRREVLYNILTRFGIPMNLFKMCLKETCSEVHIGKNMSDAFPIQNGLKQGDALLPLLFNFALECAIRKVQENQEGLELTVTYQLWIYTNNVNMPGEHINSIKKNKGGALLEASKKGGLEASTEKPKYTRTFVFHQENAR
jgi:hypothetical protein